jgi:aminoglycoside phosphotransferase (APT) family kinase protein
VSAQVIERLLASGAIAGAHRLSDVSPVKLDTTALPGGSLVMLLFVDDDAEPRYVLRVPRTPDHRERILTNYGSLRALTRVSAVAKSVPQPIFCGPVDGLLASIETCVPGLPLAVGLRIARQEGRYEETARLFDVAAQWVYNLHCATMSEASDDVAGRGGRRSRIHAAICALRAAELVSCSQASSLEAAIVFADGRSMPLSRVHGDYNPNNLLLAARDRLSVIDWEFSGAGWPLWDLFTLARTAWFHPAGIEEPDPSNALSLWDPRTPIGRAFRMALQRYEVRTGLRRDQCRTLFGVYVAELIWEHQMRDAEPGATPSEQWRTLLRAALEH